MIKIKLVESQQEPIKTEFITTLYNEEAEIVDLIMHIGDYVDRLNIIDDGSTDKTAEILEAACTESGYHVDYKTIDHTGLCELGRIEALKMCENDSWVIMLDADERFQEGVLPEIIKFINSPESEGTTHIYFSQHEVIDGNPVAEFAKVKVFRKSAAHLPEIIHKEPSFDGDGIGFNWIVWHRKSSSKQVMREIEYLQTYEKLFQEGKVTKSDVDWFVGMHHYVKPRG